MKEKSEYYPYYEKLMKMTLEQPVVETIEYKVLAGHYPHLSESIRQKRKIERLKKLLKSEKARSVKFQIKREMNATRAKIKKENILKQLHGENKQETLFRIRLASSLLATRSYMTLLKTYISAQKKFRRLDRLMRRKLPPSLFDLKSLDTADKGLAVKEWIQNRYKERE